MSHTDLLELPDGRRVQWWSGGATHGKPVVFFHGCPDTRHAAMPGAAAAARRGIRLIALNRPGYGASDVAASDHLSVADDVASVADLIGLERFAAVGMSVGGPYALACAARHPERVTAAAVVAAPGDVPSLDPPWPRDGLPPEDQEFIAHLATGSVEDAVSRIRPDFEAYVAALAPDDPDDAALAERFLSGLPMLDRQMLDGQGPAQVAAATREALTRPDGYLRDAAVTFRAWEFDIERVLCPVQLWYGALDPQTSTRNGEWLAAHLADAVLRVNDETAHLSTLHRQWDEILAGLHQV